MVIWQPKDPDVEKHQHIERLCTVNVPSLCITYCFFSHCKLQLKKNYPSLIQIFFVKTFAMGSSLCQAKLAINYKFLNQRCHMTHVWNFQPIISQNSTGPEKHFSVSAGLIYRISNDLIGTGQNHNHQWQTSIIIPLPRLAIMLFSHCQNLENSLENSIIWWPSIMWDTIF